MRDGERPKEPGTLPGVGGPASAPTHEPVAQSATVPATSHTQASTADDRPHALAMPGVANDATMPGADVANDATVPGTGVANDATVQAPRGGTAGPHAATIAAGDGAHGDSPHAATIAAGDGAHGDSPHAATIAAGDGAHGDSPHAATIPGQGDGATLAGPHKVADLPSLPRVDDSLYAIGHELARGGMGRILFARDRKLRRDVVIKVLRRDSGRIDPRFEREALITARLQHPSIVRVYDAGVLGDGRAFYAMERVRGRSLEVVLDTAVTLRDRLALLPHAIAVADAIAYAHSEGVVHRDLKPSNVLIGPFGETVLIDWGLAKDIRDATADAGERGANDSEAGSLTQHGAVMGTPSYMAPEQARGEAADERTDVYALGALLYTVLTGVPPHVGKTTDDVLAKVIAGERKPILELEPTLPPELAAIVDHAMAHEPAQRFASAKEVANELRSFAAGKLVASHSYSLRQLVKRWLARHRIAIGVAAVATAVIAVGGVLAIQNVLHERDVAERARRDAETAHDNLIFDQAQAVLDDDPSLTAAWLQRASDRALVGDKLFELARIAVLRGLAFELRGHAQDIELLAIAPDGTHVATGSDDGTVRYWTLADRRFVELRGHTGPIETLTMSPDGAYLATAGTDHQVWLWALPGGAGRKLEGHVNTVRGVAFSPHGKQLASTGEEGALWIWDVASGHGTMLYQHHHGLRPVVWLDNKTVVTGGFDGTLAKFDVTSGERTLVHAHDAEVRCLGLSPDRNQLASGDEDGIATLWTADLRRVRLLGRHTDVVRTLLFTPDGKRVISAGGDEVVHVYTLADGSTRDLTGNTSGIKDIALSPDGARVASAGLDRTVHVWSIDDASKNVVLHGHGAAVKAVVFAGNHQVVSGSEDDTARVWELDATDSPPRGIALRAWLAAHTNVTVGKRAAGH